LTHPLSTFGKSYSVVEIWTGRSDPRKGNRGVTVLDILAVHLHKIKTRSLLLSGSYRRKPVRVRGKHENALLNWLSRITELQLIDIELYHTDNFYSRCHLLVRLTVFTALRRFAGAIMHGPPIIYSPNLHTIRIGSSPPLGLAGPGDVVP
jgi:hypothetical protein